MKEVSLTLPTVSKEVAICCGEHFKTVLSIAFALLSDLLYPWSTNLSDKCSDISNKIDSFSIRSKQSTPNSPVKSQRLI